MRKSNELDAMTVLKSLPGINNKVQVTKAIHRYNVALAAFNFAVDDLRDAILAKNNIHRLDDLKKTGMWRIVRG